MLKTPQKPLFSRIVLLGALFLATSCSDGNVLGPANSLELVNEVGTFAWQVTALDKVSQTLTYSWTNNGTVANVNKSSSLGSGSATLRVTDGAGTEVHSSSLSQNGTSQTSAGTSGTWTVTVVMDGATGALNFRLETP